jgi:uncharacterized protein (DUF1697 family)
MDALRALYESLGLRDARTLLQSGNVVFRADARRLATLSRRIEDGIEARFGFRPAVILRTGSDLRGVRERNPLAAQPDIDPSRFAVVFLAGEPDPGAAERVRLLSRGRERVWLSGRELYAYFPDGFANTKLLGAALDRALGTPATGRNWNTVCKLLAAAEELESG